MQETKIHFQELDHLLRDAQLRRSADLGRWLREFFEERRRARLEREKADGPGLITTHHGTAV